MNEENTLEDELPADNLQPAATDSSPPAKGIDVIPDGDDADTDDECELAHVQRILEGAILAAGEPLSLAKMQMMLADDDVLGQIDLALALKEIQASCSQRGFELVEVASGWRFQVKDSVGPWVNRLWEEKPQKYSRALLETLALIAYRQPLTRGDIEEVRGVAVSSHIIKTLAERDWVKVVGHRDVPGRPALYATTKTFLDYFNLKSLDELPTLGELKDFDSLNRDLGLEPMDSPAINEQEGGEGVEGIESDSAAGDSSVEDSESSDVREQPSGDQDAQRPADDDVNNDDAGRDQSDSATMAVERGEDQADRVDQAAGESAADAHDDSENSAIEGEPMAPGLFDDLEALEAQEVLEQPVEKDEQAEPCVEASEGGRSLFSDPQAESIHDDEHATSDEPVDSPDTENTKNHDIRPQSPGEPNND